ncbi:dihydrofolate reductase [Devosia sp.]|jgi:hypothetical protein|uniref:dihydrofolate reductase n=1 Tax=Devosia sp. TaxID=1871048 RepID=UPI0037BEEECE
MAEITHEGHAIVSVDGMIADATGAMPPALRNDADWQSFQAALDRSSLVVLGRLGHSRHPNPGRRRLVLSRSVKDLSVDPVDQRAVFWNPAGIDIGTVLERLGIAAGTIAVTGGTRTFDLFLPHYHRFVLAEDEGLTLPAGVPCFSAGTPREVLAAHGLVLRSEVAIDVGVSQSVWERV